MGSMPSTFHLVGISDPLAIRNVVHAGLAVTVTPRMLAAQLPDLRIAAVDGPAPRRVVYALLPETGVRPLDHLLIDELTSLAE
jgi:DNA-binding transcriptional LysR family regulator